MNPDLPPVPGGPAPGVPTPVPIGPATLAPVPTLPTTEEDYYGFLRTPRFRWWKGLLGILALGALTLVLGGILGFVGMLIDLATGAITWDQLTDTARGEIPIGPALFIANNLGLAALIWASMLLNRAFFGQRGGFLGSIAGRLRWALLGRLALVLGLPWAIWVGLDLALTPGIFSGMQITGPTIVLAALTLVTTPLQSVGEEYAFRGFVPRCVAAMIPNRRAALAVAAVVGSVLFMVAHAAADPWLNVYYFGLGLVFTALTWRSGGLEASMLVHAVNNTITLVPVVLAGALTEAFNRSSGVAGPAILIPLAVGIILIGVLEWAMRRWHIARTGAPGLAEMAPPMTSPATLAYGTPAAPDDRVTLDSYEHDHSPHRPTDPSSGDGQPGDRDGGGRP